MKPNKLKLIAVGTKLIHDYKALDAGVCRYIGRRWDATLKGWPVTDKPSEVDPMPEYVEAVKRGDLAPGDEETAKYCGVSFSSQNIGGTASISDLPPYTGKI